MVELNRNFKNAILDLVWLFDRGYPKKSSIDLVGNRYMLDKKERQILFRGVFDRETCKRRKRKLVKNPYNNIDNIIIDGLNVLISIHSYLLGRIVFRSLDGYIRDISGVYGSFKYEERAKKAFEYLIMGIKLLTELSGNRINVYLFLDYRASKIGDFSEYMRKLFSEMGINSEITVSNNCDYLIVENAKNLKGKNLVATSDTAIIDKVEYVIDLPSIVIEKVLRKKVLDLKKVSGLKSVG